MQTVHLGKLGSNLSEIYAALHSFSRTGQLDLYPCSSLEVSYQGTWMGRAVKWWNEFKRWMRSFTTAPLAGESSLNEALEAIHELFQQAIRQAYQAHQRQFVNRVRCLEQGIGLVSTSEEREHQLTRYRLHFAQGWESLSQRDTQKFVDDFNAAMQRDPLGEGEVASLRQTLTAFHRVTHFFWKIFYKSQYEALRRPLQSLMAHYQTSLLLNPFLYATLRDEQRRINVEGRLEQAIPFVPLAKMAISETLTAQETSELKQWIEHLNAKQAEISFKDFEAILTNLVDVLQIQGRGTPSLNQLLLELDYWGCQLLQKEDPLYMDWREALKPGDQIECNGRPFRLGNQLSPDKPIDDEYKIFALEGEDNAGYVVKLANNAFKLKIEAAKLQRESEHWGVHPVQSIESVAIDAEGRSISGLDQSGKCVILEKLHTCLANYRWTSQASELTEEDERIALVLANHLYCQRQWKASSQNLSLEHLLFDAQGLLKSTRLLKKGPANYNDWEAFCRQAAKENPFILRFLMHVSRLSEHEIAHFYRETVEQTLATGSTHFLSHRQPAGYEDAVYRKRAEELCVKANQVYESCLKWARGQLRRRGEYTHQQEELLKDTVRTKLLMLYRSNPTPGLLLDSWQSDFMDSFSQQRLMAALAQETSLFVDPLLAPAYYQAKFECMMAKNRAVLEAQTVVT